MTDRATGKTTRAVLKAARALSKGKKLALVSGRYSESECEHFIRHLRDLVGHLGYLDGPQLRHVIRTKGGGELHWFARFEHTRGYRFDKEVQHI